MLRLSAAALVLTLAASNHAIAEEPTLELKSGDRVVLLGSTHLERAQRYGYLEAEIVRSFPQHDLVIRNLAWSGDTVFGDSWTYSKSHADHMVRTDRLYEVVEQQRPTVIIVGFGAVEAFDGAAGLPRYREGLAKMLTRLAGTGARLALLTSPPQHARISAAAAKYNPSVAATNRVVAELAKERGLPLIDVGTRLGEHYQQHPDAPLTDNGLHLNAEGYRVFSKLFVDCLRDEPNGWATVVDVEALRVNSSSAALGKIERDGDRLSFSLTDRWLPAPQTSRALKIRGLPEGRYTLYADGTELQTAESTEYEKGISISAGPAFRQGDQLRAAIVEKNRLFFARWRPENETYLSGFRRREQGRNLVELPLFDPLIAAQEDEIDRLKRPREVFYHLIPAAPASSIGPETLPDSDPSAELATFELAEGFEVNLFAAEPLVTNPINMNWDSQGRLWVTTSPIYPHLKPGQQADDKIIILEDTDGDGQADRRTVFADGLLVPTGVVPGDGGAYVANSTELVHMSDRDGDGRADHTRVLLSGFGTEDTHHILHAFRWAPGGRLFFNQSVLINSHVETPFGVRRLPAAGVWEYDVETGALEIYARGMVNPWGFQFDRWGQSFATDGAYGEGINYVWPGAAFFWARGVPRILKGMNPGQPKECGLEILSGRAIPPAWQHRLLTADFRAHRIVSFALRDNQSGYFSEQKEDLLQSSHVAFRPVDIKMGPDGAIYICDWYNSIINHGEVDFRDPRRDHEHGRIWRVTAKGRPALPNPRLDQASVAELLESLKSPEQWTRETARRELKHRDQDEVQRRLQNWTGQLSADDPQPWLEALWAFETIGKVPEEYLRSLLRSGDFRVRAAAVRALQHQAGEVANLLTLLEEAIVDEHPRVRLEAINALRGVGTLAAFDVALRALDYPMDEQIDFALWVTVRELEPVWLPSFEAGEVSFAGDVGRVAFVVAASERQSVLEPIVERYRRGGLEEDVRVKLADLIAALGTAAHLRLLFDEALQTTDAASRQRLLGSLHQAARDRGLKPSGDLQPLMTIFSAERLAISLAGLWGLDSSRPALVELAADATAEEPLRRRAVTALADLGGEDALRALLELGGESTNAAVRGVALAAAARLDLNRAAVAAVDALGKLDAGSAESVFQGFLGAEKGPAALASQLAGRQLPAEIASLGMSLASPFGERAQVLVRALEAAGGARPSRAQLAAPRWRELIAAVPSEGDPQRGERIYRRGKLSCQKCHSIGGAGGKVGPDLMSIGASAPLDYIAESLVHPSRKIKEGYETTVLILESGQVFSGLLIGEVGEQLLLRTAENEVKRVNKGQIDEQLTQSASLMPNGLTDSLTRGEFLDLVAFLTALGKRGRFSVPTRETVRVWETLDPAASGRISGTDLADFESGPWRPLFTRAGGDLPLNEVARVDIQGEPWRLARFRLDVHRRGPVAIEIGCQSAVRVWLDGEAVSVAGAQGNSSRVQMELGRGVHLLTVAVGPSESEGTTLRVERVPLANSPAQAAFRLE